jgi:hypothetical protein
MTLETVSPCSRNTIHTHHLIWAIRGAVTVTSTAIHDALCITRKNSVHSISSRFYMKHPHWCNTQMFDDDSGKMFVSDGNLVKLYLQYLMLTLQMTS